MQVREIMADRFNLLVMWKRSNVQEVLGRKLLPTPLALSGGPYLIDQCKKDEMQKISEFYQGLA